MCIHFKGIDLAELFLCQNSNYMSDMVTCHGRSNGHDYNMHMTNELDILEPSHLQLTLIYGQSQLADDSQVAWPCSPMPVLSVLEEEMASVAPLMGSDLER